ncbi:MAG: VCBS repeat-containing protein, partial [Cytophagaceae bacterium]
MPHAFTFLEALPYHLRRGALLLALSGLGPAAWGQSYGPVSTYPTASTGSQAYGLAMGDLNADGRLDIVTVNNYNNSTSSVGVLLGQAGGTFGAVTSYPLGASTNGYYWTVALGDVTGDGQPDIVTARNLAAGYVVVLPGQGGGSFGAPTTYPTGPNGAPYGVALGDLNNDGRLDIVTTTSADQVGVLLGQAGGFAASSSYPAASNGSPRGLALGDVNGDGRLDAVTANDNGHNVTVLLGQATGFGPASTYSTGPNSFPVSPTLGDVNGDGRLDIVTANGGTSTAGVLLGQAGGGFQAVSTYATGVGSHPFKIALGDVNGDGRPDLVSGNASAPGVSLLLGQAGGFAPFSALPATAAIYAYDLALGDANHDGRPDIIVLNTASNTANVLLNTGTFTPLAAAPL